MLTEWALSEGGWRGGGPVRVSRFSFVVAILAHQARRAAAAFATLTLSAYGQAAENSRARVRDHHMPDVTRLRFASGLKGDDAPPSEPMWALHTSPLDVKVRKRNAMANTRARTLVTCSAMTP